MLSTRALRSIFDGRLEEARRGNHSFAQGRLAALQEFHGLFGWEMHPSGRPMIPRDDRGLPVLATSGRAHANEVGLRPLAEAICGHDFVEEYFHPANGFSFMDLREAAIDPSAFVNINTFNLATAGLLNAEIMERFMQPKFIGRDLVTIKPTKMNGQKLIAVARMSAMSKAAKGRLPGEGHAENGFSEAYQTTPETLEQAEKIRVTREAVFYDYSDQVTEEAGLVGDDLAYGQDKDIADMAVGVTGLASEYNRNGTSSEAYQTSSPWINDQSNPFNDETDIDDARQLFVGMTDPESGKEINVEGRDILCTPARELKFREQLFGTNVQIGTQLNSNFPSRWKETSSQLSNVSGGAYNVQAMSSIWFNRLTAADGLNLSASNAKEYWFIGDFKKALWWMENWPLTPWMASADEYLMKDQGLVAVYGANYRGRGYWREPRYVVRNKN